MPHSHRAAFCHCVSPGAVLTVLPFFSIFCPESFSVCEELEGNCQGVDLHRMKGVLLLGQSHGRRETPARMASARLPAPSCSLVSLQLLLPRSWHWVAAQRAGFRVAAEGFLLHFLSLLSWGMRAS